MPSEILNKARAYEAEHGAAISPAERPAYHMTPYVGWLNDPNGFSYYKGTSTKNRAQQQRTPASFFSAGWRSSTPGGSPLEMATVSFLRNRRNLLDGGFT